MPVPFQPKFVDLVRNFTTTQGTGNFVLGAAVAGHSSLAGAVATGERFYYCAMGVDKPAEREVGRGTMLANGTIAREPVNGALTNFSNGTKTIALVVAADWFDDVGNMIHGGAEDLSALSTSDKSCLVAAVNEVAAAGSSGTVGGLALTFATAAGAPIGATITAVETSGYSAPGIGGARYVYDAAVNAAFVTAHPTWSFLAADGRGFRLNEDILQLEYFGAIPGDHASGVGADCYPAWLAMVDYQNTYPRNIIAASYKATREIIFPGHQYYFSETLNLKNSFRLRGMDNGFPAGNGTILRWPAGKTGIIGNAYNTTGLTAEGVPTTGGQSELIGFTLKGAYAGVEGEFHAIHMRGTTTLRDIMIQDWPGDGIHIEGGAGTGGSTEGNANCFKLNDLRIQGCRNGVYCDGADTNAGIGIGVDVSANRQWGIWDSSFLGNTWIGCHSDGNGLVPGTAPSVVSHAGNRYCVKTGQEAGASTNAPSGTTADNAWWYFIGAGGVSAPNNIPAWVTGTTYRAGGAYRSDGVNGETLFLGCYSEGGQGYAQGVSPTLSIGGGQGAPWKGNAVHVSNYLGRFSSIAPMSSRALDASQETRLESAADVHLRISHATKAPLEYTLAWINNNLIFNYQGAGASTHCAYEITGPSSPRNIGTHKVNFPILFGIADKKMLNGAAVPASGTYVQGDICWNSAPAAGGVPGWICTTGGTPGTWKAMAGLAA
jgi:hypothetical protein